MTEANPDLLVELLRSRFLNRDDVVAVLAPWGKPCPGSCNGSLDGVLRAHVLGSKADEIAITCETRKGPVALSGRFRIGAYSPAPDGTTRWLCIDFDGPSHAVGLADSTKAAIAAYERARGLGLPAYLERSGSGSGWHVWIFFDPPVPAGKARDLGLALAPGNLPLSTGGVSDPKVGRGIEVFPKQARLRKDGHGNLVWLPWWAGAGSGGNCFYQVSESGTPERFVPTAIEATSQETLDCALSTLGGSSRRSGPKETCGAGDTRWAEWRSKALAELPLESVYGEWLTGSTSGEGWLECRDPASPTGDQSPSAGVADGSRNVERGSFHSFISGQTISVFDFLIEHGRAGDFREACALVAKLSGVPLQKKPDPHVIVVNNRQLRDTVREAWAAVHAANHGPDLFQRMRTLVRVVAVSGVPRIDLMNEDAVFGLLARVASWVRMTEEGPRGVHPDRDTARDMMTNPDPALPHLERIVTSPVFTTNGGLALAPGFHAAARLWVHLPEGLEIPPVPERPSDEDLATARNIILFELLGDFPFAADSDRAHAVAAILLQFVRDLISGPTPIHLLESPTPGSGKGLLADVICLIFVGTACQPTTIARDEDESRKKITSLLVRGQSVNLIDNVRGVLESSQIAAAITAGVWSDRILGQTRMIDLPNRGTWLVTANNPRLSLEIARRCVRIRLDPKVDRPWQRTGFRHPVLRDWILENRARLIWAVLVLVRAWMAAGRPQGTRTLGSFESYAEVLGGILGATGIPGFLSDTEQLYEQADTEGREWRDFALVWWETRAGAWVSTSDLHQLALDRDLLLQVLGEKNERSQKIRLGKALQAQRDRNFGPYRIVSEENSTTGSARYRLIRADDGGPRVQEQEEGPAAPPPHQASPIDLDDLHEPDGER